MKSTMIHLVVCNLCFFCILFRCQRRYDAFRALNVMAISETIICKLQDVRHRLETHVARQGHRQLQDRCVSTGISFRSKMEMQSHCS